MNPKMIGATLMLGALIGVAASCSPPASQTAPQAQAEPAPLAAASEDAATLTQVASAPATASVDGEYTGDFGDAGAQVTISGSAPRYSVHLIVGGDGCGGGALGPAQADASGVLTVRPADDASCTITMTPISGGYSVAESGCSNLHGDTCSFDGEVHRSN